MIEFPTILDHRPPRLRGYSRETAVAEKFEAMVNLGLLNSRMKDVFDIWLLPRPPAESAVRSVAAATSTTVTRSLAGTTSAGGVGFHNRLNLRQTARASALPQRPRYLLRHQPGRTLDRWRAKSFGGFQVSRGIGSPLQTGSYPFVPIWLVEFPVSHARTSGGI
jgi:hypothetical protein